MAFGPVVQYPCDPVLGLQIDVADEGVSTTLLEHRADMAHECPLALALV